MGRRRTATDVTDPDTGKKLTRKELLEWRDAGRHKWYYVVRTDEFPYSYWNEKTIRFVGSFRGSASRYRTRPKAEKVAVLLAARLMLVGVIDVLERDS